MAAVKVGNASIFRKLRANIIGMIHLPASPGTPGFSGSVNDILLKAAKEAAIYKHAGMDSVLIENMHDIPYLHSSAVGPEVVSVMTAAARVVRSVFSHAPVGVQVLAGANQQALAVALTAGLDFIRAEGFVYSHVADEGLMDACAGPLLRYRRHIGAEKIAVFTDIKKKHSAHSITSDVSIAETARAAEFFRSDGVIVTGSSTGQPVDVTELTSTDSEHRGVRFSNVLKAVNIPVFVGSGVTRENFRQYSRATGLIIGSYFKTGHHWARDIDESVLADFMDMVKNDQDRSL